MEFQDILESMLKKAKSRIFLLPVLIMLLGSAIAFSVFLLSDYTDVKTAIAGNSPQWTEETGFGASFPACGSSSNTFPTCSGGSPSLTISWTWTVNATHPRECNLTNVGIYKSGVQVQGYQRACNDSVTWTGGESGTVYSYNVYFVDVDGNPPIETKSGTFTTPYCTPVSISSCSASPLTANIGEDVTWTATPSNGLAPTTPKQEWIGDTTWGGWAAPPGSDTAILARRFQATADYNLKAVSFAMAKDATVTGTLWVTIESDSGGIPSGTVLPNGTSPTIAEGQVLSWGNTALVISNGWLAFYLNNTPLVAGTNYWIVLRGSLSGPGNKIIALDTAADPNPGSLSLIHSWGAPAWTNTGASYGYRIYAPTYTYSWSGDAPLGGQTANPVTVQYPTDGSKSGSVTVLDGVSSASASCGAVTVNPPPQSDLVIQSPALSPGSPIVSQSVTFSGTVANTGTGAAGASQARVKVDLNNDGWSGGEPEFTNPTGALGVGGTEAESFAPWTSVLGTHSYQICADSGSAVAESDEGNNCTAPQPFTVSPPPPQANLIIDSHSAVPSSVIAGAPVTISGTVLNIGGASAGSSNTRLRIDVDNNGSWDTIVNAATGILASSASELEQWILPTGSAGPRTYEICADSANAVSESSELDNCVTGIYNVVNTPVLSISLSASPPSPGTAPFSTTLTADITSYTGSPSDTINYSFWWNCSQTTTNVGIAEAACGTLPAPSLGNCAENSVGYKCNAVNSTSRSVPHTYTTPTGSPFSPKVIIERNGALPKEARIPITVSWPAIGGACARSVPTADVGDPITWSALGTGGDGTYTFDWSGTGNWSIGGGALMCSGEPSAACVNNPGSYLNTGTKNASVIIRSAGLTPYTPSCPSVNISGRIISFGGDPSVIFSGGTADLKWETSGYSNGQCSINNGIGVANPAAEGSLPTPALTATTIYRITCDDGFGPEFRDATVTVGAPPTFEEVAPN